MYKLYAGVHEAPLVKIKNYYIRKSKQHSNTKFGKKNPISNKKSQTSFVRIRKKNNQAPLVRIILANYIFFSSSKYRNSKNLENN